MDFKSFILLSEASTPGAFGNDPNMRLVPNDRQSNQFQDMNKRVNFGKDIEAKIIQAISENTGWKIDPASKSEDMHDKIDGWVHFQGQKLPIQVKYRDSGDDILLEVYNSERSGGDGRDMVGRAALYACMNKAGDTIRVRDASQLKMVAKNLKTQLMESGKNVLSNRFGQIRWTNDPSSGIKKIIAYLKAEAFTGKDISLKKSVWAA